jgi:NADH-quinone oxidoreductase subunit N
VFVSQDRRMPPAVPVIPISDFRDLLPAMLLGVWGLVVLGVDGIALGDRSSAIRRQVTGWLAAAGSMAALALAVLRLTGLDGAPAEPDRDLFLGTVAADLLAAYFQLVILGLLALVQVLSTSWSFTERWGEYHALLIWAAVGAIVLIAAEELVTLFLSLETMTMCLYLAAGFEKNRRRSPEAGLKYFVYGSVASALFLYGLSLLYGMTGTTRLAAIAQVLAPAQAGHLGLDREVAGSVVVLLLLAGLGFKIAAVPFHQWAPDVYEGAPAPVTAWIVSGSKVASFIALMKILNHALDAWSSSGDQLLGPGWIGLLALIAAVTMTYGNLAALAQRNYKRLLAYSSIAHAGYMLVGVVAISTRRAHSEAAGAVLYYLIVYGFTTVGAFAVAAWMARDTCQDDIDELNGMGAESPALAIAILLLMLSLIGIPPLAGFNAKLYVFMEALNAGEQGKLSLTWLVAIALINTVISAFYYVRILRAMFLRPPGPRPLRPARVAISTPILVTTAIALIFGLAPSLLLDPMKGAAFTLLTPSSRSPVSVSPAAATSPPRPAPAAAAAPTATPVNSHAATRSSPVPPWRS